MATSFTFASMSEIAAMAPACERSVGVATRRSLRSLAVPALLALVLGTACSWTPTQRDPPMVTLVSLRVTRVADVLAALVLVLRLTNPYRLRIVVEAILYVINS